MDDKQPVNTKPSPATRPRVKPSSLWILMTLLAVAAFVYFGRNNVVRSNISWNFFWKQLAANNVASVEIDGQTLAGRFRTVPELPAKPTTGATSSGSAAEAKPEPLLQDFTVTLPSMMEDRDLLPMLREKDVATKFVQQSDSQFVLLIMYLLVPTLLFGFLWIMFRRTRDQFMGGGILSGFSKSPAKRYEDWQEADHVCRRGRPGRREARSAGNRRVPEEPRKIPATRRTRAQGHAADGPAGHRQDAAGPRRGRRSGRAVLFDQRLRVHSDVRRRRRQPRARHVQDRQGSVALHFVHRRNRRRRPRIAARAWAADTTNASKRSIRSSARWTASARPNR